MGWDYDALMSAPAVWVDLIPDLMVKYPGIQT